MAETQGNGKDVIDEVETEAAELISQISLESIQSNLETISQQVVE